MRPHERRGEAERERGERAGLDPELGGERSCGSADCSPLEPPPIADRSSLIFRLSSVSNCRCTFESSFSCARAS